MKDSGTLALAAQGSTDPEIRRFGMSRDAYREARVRTLVAEAKKKGHAEAAALDAARFQVAQELDELDKENAIVGLAFDPDAEARRALAARGGGYQRDEPPYIHAAGRNAIEKAMAYLRAQPGGRSDPYGVLHERACELVRQFGGEE